MTHISFSNPLIHLIIQDIEAGNVKNICICNDTTLKFIQDSLMCCKGKCIQNAFGFVNDLKLNDITSPNILVIEGLAISPQGHLFKHMWNRLVIHGEEYNIDVTAELFMKGVRLKYYPILEYSNISTSVDRYFSKLTTAVEKRYWYLHPTSKQHSKEQIFTKSDALYIHEFIKKFPQWNDIYDKLTIRWLTSSVDAFCSLGNLIEICETAIAKYKLNLEECFACIAHEIGHYLDSVARTEVNKEEREMNADKKVIELGLQDHLISALNKMCPNDELTKKRIIALKRNNLYNAIYIIESLDTTKPGNMMRAYGSYLAQRIESYKSASKVFNIHCQYQLLKDLTEWNDFWSKMADKCRNGEKPIIHFISHGIKDGQKIGNDIIPWKEVIEQFYKINGISHNLFVTMNVCYSSCLLDYISENTFIGCVCAFKEVYRCSDLKMLRFISFYEAILNGQPLRKAIDAFKNEILNEPANKNENHWMVCLKDDIENKFEQLPLEEWKI